MRCTTPACLSAGPADDCTNELDAVLSIPDARAVIYDLARHLVCDAAHHGNAWPGPVYQKGVVATDRSQPLKLRGMHYLCHVRLNGRTLATWYRNDEQPEIDLDFEGPTTTLEIFVHNLARSNLGHRTAEPKGLTEGIFAGRTRAEERAHPGWTCHVLQLEELPADTFLALPDSDVGCVFVNGFNIGRYCHVGPQMTLYVPGPFLRSGQNDIVVFEAPRCVDPTI